MPDLQVSSFKSDLERSFWYRAAPLTRGAAFKGDEPTVENFVKKHSQVVAFSTPAGWEMIDGLKFVHIDKAYWDGRKTGEDKKFAAALRRFVIPPIIATPGDAKSPLADKDPLRVASRGLGEVALPGATFALRQDGRGGFRNRDQSWSQIDQGRQSACA